MSGPTFSIVVPTRNRGHLLGNALETLLAQTAADFEIVVTDNASADSTKEVALASGDPRIRYVRSERPLRQHENWDFGVSHAEGEWVTVLGDDDGFVPTALERLAATTMGGSTTPVVWPEVWYYDPAFPPPWLRPGEANALTVWPFSGAMETRDAASAIDAVFHMVPLSPPGFFNALVHRDTIRRVRDRLGYVVGGPDPFIASGVAVLTQEPAVVALEVPLTLRGFSDATLSLNVVRNTRDEHACGREFDAEGDFVAAPLRERTLASLIAESLLRTKAALAEELDPYELDVVSYLRQVREELDDPRRRPDGGLAAREWKQFVAAQPRSTRSALRRELLRRRASRVARRVARTIPGPTGVASRRRRSGAVVGEFQWVVGDASSFTDLPSAAAWVDLEILPPAASKSETAA